jgi:hypothetical protein
VSTAYASCSLPMCHLFFLDISEYYSKQWISKPKSNSLWDRNLWTCDHKLTFTMPQSGRKFTCKKCKILVGTSLRPVFFIQLLLIWRNFILFCMESYSALFLQVN